MSVDTGRECANKSWFAGDCEPPRSPNRWLNTHGLSLRAWVGHVQGEVLNT